MKNWIVTIALMVVAAAGGGLYVHLGGPLGPDPYVLKQVPNALKIEKVRELAELVVLDVPISDVHVSELEGRTGGIKMILAVHGDVQITTNLEKAEFDSIDEETKSAILVLPRPEAQRPRVDHNKTRIVEFQRTGMWRFTLGDAGERTLTNRAMASAQKVLGEAAKREDLVKRACAHTETVMRNFFDAMGWEVVIQWDGDAPPKTAAASTTIAG